MSELRARKKQDSSAMSAASAHSEKARLLARDTARPAGYRRAPPPPNHRPTRSLHISISLLILGAFVIYAQKKGITGGKKVYSVDGKSLPEYYAICSKEGNKVYTVPVAGGVGATECVVVGGKEVVDSGSLAKVRRRWGDKATIGGVDGSPEVVRKAGGIKIIYLPPGHSLTPGLTDSHGHPLEYGYYSQLPLLGSRSVEEAVSRVEDFVRHNASSLPAGSWFEGMGWNQNLWSPAEFPTAADLEKSELLRGKKISLARVDVHAEWVSQAVLDELGDVFDVEGGLVLRYPDGRPTGVFVDNAISLINAIRPPMTDEGRERYLYRMGQDGLSKGMTGVHNARTPLADVRFFRKMADAGKLPMRFYTMISCGDSQTFCGDKFEKVHDAGDGRLTVRAVKLFADGALGSRGAALLEDYSDQPGWKGLMLAPEESWEPLIRQWYQAGWQVCVHTIGDRANHVVLDAIESVLGNSSAAGHAARIRLEHAQIMTPEDLKRAARLGVIGSYQPTHATSDMWYAEQRLGPERMAGAYAWQSYLQNGGRIALGSDFPVESIDPLKGYYAAVTRLSETGDSPHGPGGWYPSERLTREQALRGMTVDAAHASFSTITGSLEKGKRFDAVVWDDDLLSAPENELLDVRVKATILDGQVAWGQVA